MSAFLLFLLPFVQIGFSYYLSVATLMATIVAFGLLGKLDARSLGTCIVVAVFSGFLLLSAVALPGSTTEDLLRRGRETFFFALTVLSISAASRRPYASTSTKIVFYILAIALFLLSVTAVQMVFLKARAYFGIPKNLFIQNSETLPTLLDLRYSRIRPFGTFGEPSYLAFALLSLFVMIAPLARRALSTFDARANMERRLTSKHLAALSTMLVVAACGAMSQSLSFYLAFPVLAYFGVVRFASAKVKFWILAAAGLALFLFLGDFVASVVLGRLGSGSSDTSIAARLLVPLQIIPEYISVNPLGTPPSHLIAEVSDFASKHGNSGLEVLQNGFLNMAFNYGIMALPCVILVITSPRNSFLSLYIFFSTMLNGAIFSVDKYAVIVLTIVIYYSLMDSENAPSRTAKS